VNGRLLDADAPVLLAHDHGLTVGDGVFETCKITGGQVFALSRHLMRLGRSAAGLGLPAPDEDLLRAGVAAVVSADPLDFGRLRITMTGGPGPLGSERSAAGPTYVVMSAAQERPPATGSCVLSPWVRNERSPVVGLKTTSYAENVVALAYARERGATEAILANTVGNLCEGTGSNVCYVIDGEARTPTLASGCLAGVTRALVVEWCGVREVDEPLSVLDGADEIFLVSTTRDVQPLSRLDDRDLGEPGAVTLQAMKTWAAREADGIDP
jgi:branched-chain amino acid aminotransferase